MERRVCQIVRRQMSLPTRGGWIEITVDGSKATLKARPSPHGEGGLKRGGCYGFALGGVVPPHTGRVD